MSRVAFTDYSGLGNFGRTNMVCRSRFFVITPAFLDQNEHVLDHGFVWNGALGKSRFELHQQEGGWAVSIDVDLSGFMHEPDSGFAEYLLNQSLDTLALRFASPFQCVAASDEHLTLAGSKASHSVGAVVGIRDIDESIRMGMLLYTFEDTLLKALSWYRRGISSADPVLAFLGLWNSLETVAAKFHTPNEETPGKSKKQVAQLLSEHLQKSGFQFFKPNSDEMWNWVESNYESRKDLAHGLNALNPSSNDELRRAIPKLKSVVAAILRVMLDTRCTENEDIAQVLKQAEKLKKQREGHDQPC